MLVKDWLGEFLEARFSRELRDERTVWHAWLRALIEIKATQGEAQTAARHLEGQRFDWPADYLVALLTQIGAIRNAVAAVSSQGKPGAESKDERYAEAAKAINEVGAMTREQRLEFATQLLDQFADLGWMMEWHEDEQQFRTIPTQPGAPQPATWLATRLRALRAEVYAILGHPLPGSEPVPDMDEFADADPKVRWRRMVEALGEVVHAPEIPCQGKNPATGP